MKKFRLYHQSENSGQGFVSGNAFSERMLFESGNYKEHDKCEIKSLKIGRAFEYSHELHIVREC